MNFISAIALLRLVGTSAADSTAPTTAAAGNAAAAAGCTGGSSWTIILLYAAVLGVCYLLLIRPQKKRRQEEENLRKSVEIGDEITTIGGICGRIVSVKEDDTLVIESGADRNKIKIKTWAISSNETAKDKAAAAAANAPKKKGLFANFGKKKDDAANTEQK